MPDTERAAGDPVLLGALVSRLQGGGADHRRASKARTAIGDCWSIGPTRRYGYAAGGVDATPAEELAHIEKVRQQYYGTIRDMAVPVSDEDALGYGMDATPTLVLIDRAGQGRALSSRAR